MKHCVYNFRQGNGGIGDYIKFYMVLLKLCIKYNHTIQCKVNNHFMEKYIILKNTEAYITEIPEKIFTFDEDYEKFESWITNESQVAEESQDAQVAEELCVNECSEIILLSPDRLIQICRNTSESFKTETADVFAHNYNENLNRIFNFSDEVKKNAQTLCPLCFSNSGEITNYSSIHLRLGDKFLETDNQYVNVKEDVRRFSEERLYKFIETNSDKTFMFFCDNNKFRLMIKNKYNNIIIPDSCIGNTSLNNTTDKQTLDAVSEFYLLSNSKEIYQGSNSGFSLIASKFNSIPLIKI